MDLTLDRLRIAAKLADAACAHNVRSVLHVGVETGMLGACLRHALDYAHGRTAQPDWKARIHGLTASGSEVPFGACYDAVEADPPDRWLASRYDAFDLVLAPRAAVELPRDQARALLHSLYERAAKLLVTVVANDLPRAHEPQLESLYTLPLLSADFARVRFSEIGDLVLATVRNEFLPL